MPLSMPQICFKEQDHLTNRKNYFQLLNGLAFWNIIVKFDSRLGKIPELFTLEYTTNQGHLWLNYVLKVNAA